MLHTAIGWFVGAREKGEEVEECKGVARCCGGLLAPTDSFRPPPLSHLYLFACVALSNPTSSPTPLRPGSRGLRGAANTTSSSSSNINSTSSLRHGHSPARHRSSALNTLVVSHIPSAFQSRTPVGAVVGGKNASVRCTMYATTSTHSDDNDSADGDSDGTEFLFWSDESANGLYFDEGTVSANHIVLMHHQFGFNALIATKGAVVVLSSSCLCRALVPLAPLL